MAILAHETSWPTVHATTSYGTVTLYPCNDTMTTSVSPNSQTWYNYVDVSIGNVSGMQYEVWLKFNLSSITSLGNISIYLATFYWYCNGKNAGNAINQPINLTSIDPTNESSWADSNITWNNAPTMNNYNEFDGLWLTSGYNAWYSEQLSLAEGMPALQDAYNNNRTKSYVLFLTTNDLLLSFITSKSGDYKPYIFIRYSQTSTGEPTEVRGSLSRPEEHTFTFLSTMDVEINSLAANTNYANESIAPTEYSRTSPSVTINLLFKFNLSIPTYIDNKLNIAFDFRFNNFWSLSITFRAYCDYVGSAGFNILQGIYRANESWNPNIVTWNTGPTSRGTISYNSIVDNPGYISLTFSSTEENYIRYSIDNNYSYTVVLGVDEDACSFAWMNWRMLEYNSTKPTLTMDADVEAFPNLPLTPVLTWFNAPYNLGLSWGLAVDSANQTCWLAGEILTLAMFMVTVVPITWATQRGKRERNDILFLVLTVASLGIATFLTWNDVKVFMLILILLILWKGGILKR